MAMDGLRSGVRVARAGTSALALSLLAACAATDPITTQAISEPNAKTAEAATTPAPVPADDLALGKTHFRAGNHGLAELHFRRAAEKAPGDAEAWLGLAAAYDQLKRYRLADRAYGRAGRLLAGNAEFLNNRGYSYFMRGDLRRASETLTAAAAKAPDNEHIQNNLKLLDERARQAPAS